MSDQDHNKDGYDEICSICRRPESQAGKLVRMPMNMYICPECMDKLSDMIDAQMGGMNGAGAIDWSKVMSMYNPSTMQMDPRMFHPDMTNKSAEEPAKDGEAAVEKEARSGADDAGELKKNETDEPEKKDETKKPGNGIPKVSFVNFADLPFDFGFGGRQKVKKKEKGEHKPLIELKDIPAPHKIKA
ncbi:MAG: ClpX C4-type zinc finger protein, partial [Lachnospiraceae bacterium]|nr:ClpX C4-type zinc finger protein [Lachnospiraceae bacterium]